MQKEEIREIQISIEEAEQMIEDLSRLNRLKENEDFKVLFMQRFLKDEAVRLVHLKQSPAIKDNSEAVEGIDTWINAIGVLVEFMRMVEIKGYGAKMSLDEYKEMLEQVEIDD